MKSAYEIAMERLEREHGKGKSLTDEQKAEIAEIDKTYEAKIAQVRLEGESKIATAESPSDAQQRRAEMAETIASLEAEREKEKDAIWNAE